MFIFFDEARCLGISENKEGLKFSPPSKGAGENPDIL